MAGKNFKTLPLMLLLISASHTSWAEEKSSLLTKVWDHFSSSSNLPAPKGDAVVAPSTSSQIKLSFAGITKQAKPAVVSISAVQVVPQTRSHPFFNDPFFRMWFDQPGIGSLAPQQIEKSLGSGVIIDPEGFIVTCYHVIKNAKAIQVKLDDNRVFNAEVVVKNVKNDLAILKIQPDKGKGSFPYLKLGTSKNLEIGDLVLAIGNPFGIGMTVTQGIVSAVARSFNGQILMQTDAAVNPGNSGGGLVDINGLLIGIPNAIVSQTGASHGIGFAIPAVVVHPLLAAAKGDGKVVYPWDGLHLKSMNHEEAESFGFDQPTGVLVAHLHPQSPAGAQGIKVGDIIVKVNEHPLYSLEDYQVALQGCQVGETIHLAIFRKGKIQEVSFKLIAPPASNDANIHLLATQGPFAGIKVANLSPALAMEYNLSDTNNEGVVVLEAPSSFFSAVFMPLQFGDIIEKMNEEKVTSVKHLISLIEGGAHSIMVRRGTQRFVIQLQ